jgi:hypothetical protein
MIEVQVLNLENLIPLELVTALNEDAVLEVMRDVIEGARDHWIKLASERFHTTKTTYINGIQPVEWRGNDLAIISLVGMLPNMLEQGMGQKDLHDTLLGPNVPTVPVGQKGKHPRKEGGYFRAVPYRHRTPGAGAYGAPMGKALEKLLGSAWSQQLGKDIYNAAKQLAPTLTDPYTGKTSWGERLDTGNIRATKTRQSVYVPKAKPYHAVDPYSGMVRQEKTYGGATQSSYTTFRTISVDAQGAGIGSSPWIRPATPGALLAQQVAEYVSTRLAPMAFQAYVDSIK